MSKIEIMVDGNNERHAVFHCPGCECSHSFALDGKHPRWDWNGSLDSPTFKPSLRCIDHDGKSTKCHLFVTDGKIRFLRDCKHQFAGQTIELLIADDDSRP
jgi:hypothetical protein